MLLEGTAIYFWLLILILLLVYITKKVSLYFIFKKVRMNPTTAFIPIKYRADLAYTIGVDTKKAYMSYIPFYGLKYRKEILDTLLKGFNLNNKNSFLYFLIPMYKYPELAFRKVKFVQNDYSLTEKFLETEKTMSGVEEASGIIESNVQNSNAIFNDSIFSDNGVSTGTSTVNNQPDQNMDNVFTNQNLQPDERHETYVEVEREEKQEVKPIITPLQTGENQVCPKCGATLVPNATTCFMCGNRLV